MRSFLKILYSANLVAIGTIVLMALSFGALLVIGQAERVRTAEYRRILSGINGTISILNDVRRSETVLDDSDEFRRQISSLSETIDASRYAEIGANPVFEELFHGTTGLEADEVVAALGSLARTVGDSYYRTGESLYRLSNTIALVFFGLTVGAVVWLIGIRRWIRRFVETIADGIQQLQSAISYRSVQRLTEPHWQEEKEFFDAVDRTIIELGADRDLSEMGFAESLEGFLPRFKRLIEKEVPCDRLALAFINPYGNVVAESAATDLNVLFLEPGFIEPLSETTLSTIADTGGPRIINDLEKHFETVHKSRGTELILQEGIRSSLTMPITVNRKPIGFLFVNSTRKNAYDHHHTQHALRLVNPVRQVLYYQFLFQQVIAETTKSFVALMATRDNETSLHLTRMALYSYHTAKKLFEEEEDTTARLLREILWFAPLHDIGKIGIPDSILHKPGPLTEDEFETMKTHVVTGERVLTSIDASLKEVVNLEVLKTAIDLTSSHHERWDGTGYPRGLNGEEIPLVGRIVAIADVFDALTTRRPYKEAYSVEKSRAIIRESVGSHFDPRVFRAFDAALPEILAVYEKYKEVD